MPDGSLTFDTRVDESSFTQAMDNLTAAVKEGLETISAKMDALATLLNDRFTEAMGGVNVYECTQGGNEATALWVYAGNWRGAAGAGNVSFVDGVEADIGGDVPLGAVRYGAQTLTAAQQAQARANVGAQARVDAVGLLKGTGGGGVLAAAPGQDYAKATRLTATLPVAGWTGTGPYTQTVAVSGILATDTPTVDVVLSDVAATAQAQLEAYGFLGRVTTGGNAITATCYEEAPTFDLTLSLLVVRGNTEGEAGADLTAGMVETSEAGVSVQAKLDAVDAAMAEKADRSDVMRRLISRTIQAGESVAAILWSQDDDGHALSLQEAELRIWVPANGATVGNNVNINGKVNGIASGYFVASSDNNATFEAGIFRAAFGSSLAMLKLMGDKFQCTNLYRYSDGTTRASGMRVSGNTGSITSVTSITLTVNGGGVTTFPVGTILELYGR